MLRPLKIEKMKRQSTCGWNVHANVCYKKKMCMLTDKIDV